MSDTVKIIIEMPKAEYERLVYIDSLKLRSYVENGKPLDDVLGEIKAEIGWRNSAAYMGEYNVGLQDALKVIDKYTKRGYRMTTEEAKIQIEYRKDFATPAQIEALDMELKALDEVERYKQAIDDIKAEILSLKGDNFPNDFYVKIIDKHIKEVES